MTAASSDCYELSAAPFSLDSSAVFPSSFFFLPFMTFGAVLRPATTDVLAVASLPFAVDCLRFSPVAAVLAVASFGLVSAAGFAVASVVFFSSLGLVVAAAPVLGAAVEVAGLAPAFFSTT